VEGMSKRERRTKVVEREEKVVETMGIMKMGGTETEHVVVPFRRGERIYSLEWLDGKD
jgi:hypothetical protein